jgi:CRP/FNR family transcriptional regulator, anaerobic regulatory protein|uniref:Crp/Fnr family transcriptional regulator n=1 Tax=Daejeonella sp. TaxID=2805397 RepID=UPI00404A3600
MIKAFTFPKEIYDEIMNDFEVMHVNKNTIIVSEGDLMRKIPFIKSGLVSVYKEELNLGREILLYQVGPNQTCMMSIIASIRGTRSLVNARAESDSELILVPTEKIRDWQLQYPSWNQFILNIFMDRYDELLDTIYEITFGKIESRIIKKLAEIEVKNNSKDIEITHQALANMLGTTRVVVSRILKKLENEGLIHLNRGTINRI